MRITERQMEYLMIIVRLQNCAVRELAREAKVRPTAATEAVRRLRGKGLVKWDKGVRRTVRPTKLGEALTEPVWIKDDLYQPIRWFDA